MKKLFVIPLLSLLFVSCEKWFPGDNVNSDELIELDQLYNVTPTKDNGYLIIGDKDLKVTIIRTDANFRTMWERNDFSWGKLSVGSFGGGISRWFSTAAVFQNENGNFYIVGSVSEGGCVIYTKCLIIELDGDGNDLKLMEMKDIYPQSAIQTLEGGFLFRGYGLWRFDRFFGKMWERPYTDSEGWTGPVIYNGNSTFAATSWGSDGASKLKIFNDDGTVKAAYAYTFGPLHIEETGNDLARLPNGDYLIVGRSRNLNSPLYDMDFGATTISSTGEKKWSVKFGSDRDEYLEKIIYTSKDYNIIQGIIGYPNDDFQGSFFVKLGPGGNIIDSCTTSRVDALIYRDAGYFIKTEHVENGVYRLTKIPLSGLF